MTALCRKRCGGYGNEGVGRGAIIILEIIVFTGVLACAGTCIAQESQAKSQKEELKALQNTVERMVKERHHQQQKEEFKALENKLSDMERLKSKAEEKMRAAEQALEKERLKVSNLSAGLEKAADAAKEKERDIFELKALSVLQDARLKNLEGLLKSYGIPLGDDKKPAKVSGDMKKAISSKVRAERQEKLAEMELEEIKRKTNKERLNMHYNLAVVYDRNGLYKDAEREYLKCLEIDPKDADVHYNLGILYDDKLNNNGRAMEHYEKFLLLRPMGDNAELVRQWKFHVELEQRIGSEVR